MEMGLTQMKRSNKIQSRRKKWKWKDLKQSKCRSQNNGFSSVMCSVSFRWMWNRRLRPGWSTIWRPLCNLLLINPNFRLQESERKMKPAITIEMDWSKENKHKNLDSIKRIFHDCENLSILRGKKKKKPDLMVVIIIIIICWKHDILLTNWF